MAQAVRGGGADIKRALARLLRATAITNGAEMACVAKLTSGVSTRIRTARFSERPPSDGVLAV